MIDRIKSKFGCEIRLTDERWAHITEEHGELAGLRPDVLAVVASPDYITQGNRGEFIAVGNVKPGKFLVVVFREEEKDGFIITAFFTKRCRALKKRNQLWP